MLFYIVFPLLSFWNQCVFPTYITSHFTLMLNSPMWLVATALDSAHGISSTMESSTGQHWKGLQMQEKEKQRQGGTKQRRLCLIIPSIQCRNKPCIYSGPYVCHRAFCSSLFLRLHIYSFRDINILYFLWGKEEKKRRKDNDKKEGRKKEITERVKLQVWDWDCFLQASDTLRGMRICLEKHIFLITWF